MIQRILLTMILLIFFAGQAAFSQPEPEQVSERVSKAMAVEGEVQERADNWDWEKKDMIDEIRDLKYRVTWLQYRQEKNRVYIENVKENIKNLEFKKAEINKLREHLEPYLEEVVTKLESFVENDMPFLAEERQKRLQALKNSMDNYDVALSEKLRRVFAEGLEIEVEYGQMVEAIEDQMLKINGINTEVVIFRLGRVAMLYMSLDGTQLGQWNHKTRQWEPISDDLYRNVRRALDIAQRKRTVEIVEIPLGAL
jgi:hypothetical protein